MEDPVPGALQRSLTAGPGDLRRSNQPLARSPSYHQHQAKGRRGGGGGGGGVGAKPTLEIYRPPNVRVDVVNLLSESGQKLNVHAKEFTMHSGDLNSSRSSGNIAAAMSNHIYNNNNNHVSTKMTKMLQQSKSSGNVMHSLQRNYLQQSTSSGNVLQQSPRVHFRFDVDGNPSAAPAASAAPAVPAGQRRSHRSDEEHLHAKALRQSKTLSTIQPTIIDKSSAAPVGLKRSKSMAAADSLGTPGVAREAPELGSFPPEVHAAIQRAVEDPNQVSARSLMQLVRHIMDRVVESRLFAEPAAKLCITIIEKEKNETFLESLLNTCQLWYQSRDKYLRSPRYPAFMAFLNEMYCQLKRRQLQLRTQYDGVSPGLLLLTLLAKCCQDCLKPPAINSLKEMECLFFVVSSIGRDLETELPARMNAILGGVRDAFLTSTVVPAIRKTLLQLIELHAAQWQLPAPAIMYYYPTTTTNK